MKSEITRLNILVEGQTEEAFIRDVLAPHLTSRMVFATCRRVETSRRKEKVTGQTIIFRGGIVSYLKLRNDVLRWLKEDPDAFLTTMLDVYALPSNFPEFENARKNVDAYEKVAALEAAFYNDVGYRTFIPYLQLHEYEGLLFSDPSVTDSGLRLFGGVSRLAELCAIRAEFPTPEHIDEGVTTAPSKRLKALFPAYDKLLFGPLIASSIGLTNLRQHCVHFNEWVSRLENLH